MSDAKFEDSGIELKIVDQEIVEQVAPNNSDKSIDKNMPKMENFEQVDIKDLDNLEEYNKKNKPQIIDAQLEKEDCLLSEKQKLEEKENEKEEEEKGGKLFWGLLICAAVLTAPLGGGFAFLLAPAQLASFGLIPFWKQGKYKNKIKIPSAAKEKGVFESEKNSKSLIQEEINEKSKLLSNSADKYADDSEVIRDMANKDGHGTYVKELMEKWNKILLNADAKSLIEKTISNNNLLKNFEKLNPENSDIKNEENREKIIEELLNSVNGCLKEIIGKKEFMELKSELEDISKGLEDKKIKEELFENIMKNSFETLGKPLSLGLLQTGKQIEGNSFFKSAKSEGQINSI